MALRPTLLDGADVVVLGDSNWHLVGRLVSRFLEVSTLQLSVFGKRGFFGGVG
jgi:hypothetical protein